MNPCAFPRLCSVPDVHDVHGVHSGHSGHSALVNMAYKLCVVRVRKVGLHLAFRTLKNEGKIVGKS